MSIDSWVSWPDGPPKAVPLAPAYPMADIETDGHNNTWENARPWVAGTGRTLLAEHAVLLLVLLLH